MLTKFITGLSSFLVKTEAEYPNQVVDLYVGDRGYYIEYKIRMMPQTRTMLLAQLLNSDDLIMGFSPVEIRALTQLECMYRSAPTFEINSEIFSKNTSTYKILINRIVSASKDKCCEKIECDLEDFLDERILALFSHMDAFKLGHSYALRKK